MRETVAKAGAKEAPRDVTQLSDAELIQQIWTHKAKWGRSTGPRLRTRNRERQESDVVTAPTGMLDRCALLAACAAAGALP
jgi:hypothetical protein